MKIASIVGARPQFIKILPIVKAIEKHNLLSSNSIEHIIIHTGQHYDYLMNKVFFDELGIPEPNYNLEVGSGTHGYQTGEMLKRAEELLIKVRPDIVIVYGDTNSTLAGALASSKLHIKVAHVEAGLRSFNKRMPEEINRVLVDHVSDYLFCPTETAVKNLKKEGITEGVYLVGDVMYDALLYSLKIAERKNEILQRLNLKSKGYALVTIHRAENTNNSERLTSIFLALKEIAKDGLKVIVPLHPRTKNSLNNLCFDLSCPNLYITDPISYFEMLILEKNAKVILTDSGGVQKEAYFLKVPCITLREETEWIETVESGWNVLAGADKINIIKAFARMSSYKPPDKFTSLFGNDKASERIVKILDISGNLSNSNLGGVNDSG